MITDRDLGRLVAAWLDEPAGVPDDFGEVLAQLSSTRQHHGRLTPPSSWGFQQMFSATKFVVAGLIVALFGGLAAVGLLGLGPSQGDPATIGSIASPDAAAETPAAAIDPLPGVDLELKEVEPGVYRVDGDGIRELRSQLDVRCDSPDYFTAGKIVAGLDGTVRLFWDDAFVALGDPVTHHWQAGQVPWLGDDIEVAPDGTVWYAPALGTGRVDRDGPWACTSGNADGALRAFDGATWAVMRHEPYATVGEVEVLPDGTVWAAWSQTESSARNRSIAMAAWMDGSGWHVIEDTRDLEVAPSGNTDLDTVGDLAATPAGTLMLTQRHQRGETLWLYEPDDGSSTASAGTGRWLALERPDDDVRRLAAAPDGTLWAWIGSDRIGRYDGTAWSVSKVRGADRLGPLPPSGVFEVAADGALWLRTSDCDGALRFDGTTWTRYLEGLCVYSADSAPDGATWLRAGRWTDPPDVGSAGPVDTYVVFGDAT